MSCDAEGDALPRPRPVLRGGRCSGTPTRIVTGRSADGRRTGTTFGAPTPGEVLLAEAICARVPGCEQVRLVSSGTEAAMSAVRLARGATGRDRIIKFDGCYHGHSDGLLAGGGSGVAMLGLPGSAGVSAGAVARHVVVPYNVGARPRRATWPASSSSRWRPTWASSPRRPGSSKACAPPATRPARSSSSTRSSPASGSARAGPPAGPASRPTSGASARSSAAACRSAPSAAGATLMSSWRRRAGVPGRHAVGEPAGHRGRPGRARPRRPRRTTRPCTPGRSVRRGRWPRPCWAAGCRRTCRAVGPLVGLFVAPR